MHDDKDAEDVIALMNNLLLQQEGVSPLSDCKEGEHSLHTIDFDNEFGSLLCTSSGATNDILAGEFNFDGENVADLFRSMRDQTQLQMSFQSWRGVCSEQRGQRCRSFGAWKKIVRDKADKANRSVLRFRRQQRLRRARRILTVWRGAVVSRHALLDQMSSYHGLKVKTAVFSRWKDVHEASRQCRQIHRADSARKERLARVWFRRWKSSCAGASQHMQRQGNKEPSQCGASPVNVITPTKVQGTPTIVAPSPDDAPNRETAALRPVSLRSKPRQSKNPSTPRAMVEMNRRAAEREKRRALLKAKYKEKANEREIMKVAEQKKRDLEATLEHRRFLEEKRQQAQDRATQLAKRKDQMRAAVVHSNLLLKRRYLKQWKLIFNAKAFNERKACLAWQDRTLEKVYMLWRAKALELRRRREQLEIDSHNQAVDFYSRTLVSKAWASWEDFSKHKREQSEHITLQIQESKKRAVMRAWCSHVTDMRGVHLKKESIADEHRRSCLKVFVLRSWADGAALMQEERRIDALVKEKWKQVDVWLNQACF